MYTALPITIEIVLPPRLHAPESSIPVDDFFSCIFSLTLLHEQPTVLLASVDPVNRQIALEEQCPTWCCGAKRSKDLGYRKGAMTVKGPRNIVFRLSSAANG